MKNAKMDTVMTKIVKKTKPVCASKAKATMPAKAKAKPAKATTSKATTKTRAKSTNTKMASKAKAATKR